jgi:hypothetical protein
MVDPIVTGVAAVLCAFAALALLASPNPARAQSTPPDPGWSAVDAYVEQVPSAGGGSAPGVQDATQSSLPPAAEAALETATQPVRNALEKVVSSSAYGAPQTEGQAPVLEPMPDESPNDPLRGTADALGTVSDARLLALLFVLLATTVAALVLALLRARRPSAFD